MITNLFLSVAEISLSVSLIVLLMLLLSPLFTKRYGSKWSYWIWIFLALRLLIPFRGADGITLLHALQHTSTQNSMEDRKNHQAPLPEKKTSVGMILELPAQMTAPIQTQSKKGGIQITPLDLIAIVWMLGSHAFLSIHLISYFHYKSQVRKRGTILKNSAILRQLSSQKRELHIKSTVQVVEFTQAPSPMLTGFLNPILILPKASYSEEELSFIFRHELVHLKRKDVFVKLLLAAANGIHWFNPLIWLMQKEAVLDMELSCDERVIEGADYHQRKAYTEVLLSLLCRGCTQKTRFSTEFYGGKQSMKKRFKNILNKRKKKNGAAIFLCVLVLTVTLGATIGCSTAKESGKSIPEQTEETDTYAQKQDTEENQETENQPTQDNQSVSDMPQNGQIYGYVREYSKDTLTIDRQIWATPESPDWKPEYDEDAGFEVVDAPGEALTYTIHPECTYSSLENHQGPPKDLIREEFEACLREMEYPILWLIDLEDGQIKSIQEQYRP